MEGEGLVLRVLSVLGLEGLGWGGEGRARNKARILLTFLEP